MVAPAKRRLSKRALRLWAALAGLAGFALPWAAVRTLPVPTASAPQPRFIVVPAGARVVLRTGTTSRGAITLVPGTRAGPAPATTSGSKPPP
jgi:hypothetical protein